MALHKKVLRYFTYLFMALICIVALYAIPVLFPNPFFQWSVSYANLTLSSDRYFDSNSGRSVLVQVESKLQKSRLYDPEQRHSIFICNSEWRQRLFFSYVYGVGGVNYYPLTTNVFLSGANLEENRLISPSGNVVDGNRTLDYFAAHEIVHTLIKQRIGIVKHEQLPEYVTEGIPDFIGMGESFNYSKALTDFLDEVPEMDRARSGLYYRYQFLISYLINEKGWNELKLIQSPPTQREVEQEIGISKGS